MFTTKCVIKFHSSRRNNWTSANFRVDPNFALNTFLFVFWSVWVYWICYNLLWRILTTRVLHLELVTCKIQETHPYFAHFHGGRQCCRWLFHLRDIDHGIWTWEGNTWNVGRCIRTKTNFVFVVGQIHRVLRHRWNLSIPTNHGGFPIWRCSILGLLIEVSTWWLHFKHVW